VGDVVNLNRVRKRTARDKAEQDARANRAKFGRTKTERTIEAARADLHDTRLEQHRIDREDKP
jgi:Domain of unknown function (DUF4169)